MTEWRATSPISDLPAAVRDLQVRVRRLERREWWIWWASIVVMLLLTTAVVSLALPQLAGEASPFVQLMLSQAVRGLVGLVLLFNLYTIYQYFLIRRLRRKLADEMQKSRELENRADALYQLAVEDPLTGLYNRRFADQRLATEIARSQRHGRPFTVVCLDLDNFKQINDAHGHAAGDAVLKEFAARLLGSIRTADMAARIGGDEFLVVLLECPIEFATRLVARLHPFEVEVEGKKLALEISAGWTGYQPGDTAESLMARADQALYDNKRKAKSDPAVVDVT
jgi:diguanylate cyclase (GGDEF)-like protein